ncbi:pilin [Niallia sp. HCP3S3_B10]|uniref:pilin n=1 Tax=Niallia sp. HCP3S3_B10 TaxID=3438944 RepID=UPI003F887E4B
MKTEAFKRVNGLMDIPFYLGALLLTYLYLIIPDSALAAWKKAGITSQGNVENSKIYTQLNNVVYLITGIGAIWALACIVFAGMKLSGSQGNPQSRTQGFVGLAMAGVGVFVIVQAKTIAGYFAGFGI